MSWDDLRKPFPKEVVGKLPRGGIQLDYVGHAAVTDRLLNVDPEWHWEPLATDEAGNPALDAEGNLWIKLTVMGVTRLGVGDGRNMKERIGDALRNAAMRFGVALDLWSKDELESTLEHPELKNEKPSKASVRRLRLTADQISELLDLTKRLKGITEKNEAIVFICDALGVDDLFEADAVYFDEYKKAVIQHQREAA